MVHKSAKPRRTRLTSRKLSARFTGTNGLTSGVKIDASTQTALMVVRPRGHTHTRWCEPFGVILFAVLSVTVTFLHEGQ